MVSVTKKIILGAHLSIEQGFAQAALNTAAIGATAAQIFSKSNRTWQTKPIDHADIKNWDNACKQSNLLKKNICIHASYLINLASEKKLVVTKAISALICELERATLLEIPTVVLHPGSRGDQSTKDGCQMVSNGLVEVFENTKTTIIALESMAGQGTSLGSSLEELAIIIEEVPKKFHSRIGVCLDTCHLFAAGYRLDTQTTYQEFWKDFDTIIGRDYLKIIHINDSKKEFNSRVDRHEEIEKGLIPKNVFIQLMNDTSLVDIPKILETPKTSLNDDARNIKRLLSYI